MTRPLTILSAANAYDEARFADHHLGRALAAHGPVLYVDPPLSPLEPLRRVAVRGEYFGPRVREVAPGLFRYTMRALPGPERALTAPVTAAAMRRGIRRTVLDLGYPVGAHIATSVLLPVFDPSIETASVFWFQDDFVGGAALMGVDPARNARGEVQMLRAADAVVATNPVLVERSKREGVTATCIPFGCDIANFRASVRQPAPADVAATGPYALLMGQLGDRVDCELLMALADRNVSLVLVGPFHDPAARDSFAPLLARPNVQYLGAKAFSDLAPYLAGAGVGLVPYRDNAFNRGSFPLKTLEYLAAGLPVVATDLPAVRWLGTPEVAIAREPDQFADAVVAALRAERSVADVQRRRTTAEQHTWSQRADQWIELLDALANRRISCVS